MASTCKNKVKLSYPDGTACYLFPPAQKVGTRQNLSPKYNQVFQKPQLPFLLPFSLWIFALAATHFKSNSNEKAPSANDRISWAKMSSNNSLSCLSVQCTDTTNRNPFNSFRTNILVIITNLTLTESTMKGVNEPHWYFFDPVVLGVYTVKSSSTGDSCSRQICPCCLPIAKRSHIWRCFPS